MDEEEAPQPEAAVRGTKVTMLPGLDGAIAVVTGCSTGIGKACADVLSASGATVFAVSRSTNPSGDVRLLRAACGAVVCMTSQAAIVSLPAQAAYSASKGAVAALTRSLAIDWAEAGVRVNSVAPGSTATPMTETFFADPTLKAAVERRIPLGRVLRPEEVAHAAVFLASPAASAVAGVALPVDGGWTAGEPALPW